MTSTKFINGTFCIDGRESYKGKYVPSTRWNGWFVPYFDLETAHRVAKDHSLSYTFDEATDTFTILLEGDEMHDEYQGQFIDGVKMYSIGGYSWIWDTCK